MTEPVYIIGIDLGTTNSVVAYTEAEAARGGAQEIRIFEVPQLVDPGSVEKKDMLPSFILVPGRHDVAEESLGLPWNPENTVAVGEFARKRGAEIPARLISSAKSWLCNTLVDRNKAILPWESPADTARKSPVEAAAAILKHLRDAWDHTMAAEDQRLRMENQEIFLTVPASFDAVARELTVKAAETAGLARVTLLEEPQAAFYAWIESLGDRWRDHVEKGDVVLVCDVGGGTTDFSLIQVTEEAGELALERIAVGDHLLVGGDNMDLTLAYTVSKQLQEKGTRLGTWQMRGLWHSCRNAKEKLLSDPEIRRQPVTVLGRGTGLIAGTIKTDLAQEDVEAVILDGFFPRCQDSDRPAAARRAGIREFGLSYEADPGITRHLAQFLALHQHAAEGRFPTAILFNGGVMKSDPIRGRVKEVLSSWSGASRSIRELESRNFDLAVARGAAYYGRARRGEGIRIRAGLEKSYYIGVAASMPAVPGMPAPLKAICVGPFGMEEGTEAALQDQDFVLVVGEPVSFDFLGSSRRYEDQVGTVVEDWEPEIEKITTIESTLEGEYGETIPVSIEIRVTEIGTLELWCVSREDDRRWRLEFNVRERENTGI